MNPIVIMALLGLLVGGVLIGGAIFNWDWLLNTRRARLFVKIFGRGGTRIILGIIGFLLLGMGVASSLVGMVMIGT